jgi:hypothetical protein
VLLFYTPQTLLSGLGFFFRHSDLSIMAKFGKQNSERALIAIDFIPAIIFELKT